jgi:hypothetical protein
MNGHSSRSARLGNLQHAENESNKELQKIFRYVIISALQRKLQLVNRLRSLNCDMKKVKTRAFSRFNANRAPSHGGTER